MVDHDQASLDAAILELEDQRNMFATRCTVLASLVAVNESIIKEMQEAAADQDERHDRIVVELTEQINALNRKVDAIKTSPDRIVVEPTEPTEPVNSVFDGIFDFGGRFGNPFPRSPGGRT
jgi:hypothetical protein